jgi:hypothetical protein
MLCGPSLDVVRGSSIYRLLGSLSCAAGTLSRGAAGFERGSVLIGFSEDPMLGDKLPRFSDAASTGKTMARLALANGPRLGRVQGRLGR